MGNPNQKVDLDQVLQQRRKELEHLKNVREITGKLSEKLEEFTDNIKKMQDGSKSITEVTSLWNQIISSIALADDSTVNIKESEYETGTPLTERLVRCKVDKNGRITDKTTGE